MKKIVFVVVYLVFSNVFGQDCSCEENFNWMKKTFEENDAGFQFSVEQKGKAAYEKHNELFLQKIKKITNLEECADALYDWLLFFRKGHISVNIHQDNSAGSPLATSINTANWEQYTVTDKEFGKYLSKVKQPSFEGIWKVEPYTVGIVKKGEEYIGFIIDAPGTDWKRGQVKFRFNPAENGSGYSGTFYMRNFSANSVNTVKLTGNNFLQLDNFLLHRVNPVSEDSKAVKNYIELMKAQTPFIKQYSDNTIVLRIPSFDGSQKKAIDSLLHVYHDKITTTPNLVIDIRGNGGGSDGSYSGITPYLYTNPIRIVTLEMLSTPLNNQRMEGFLSDEGISEKEREDIKADLKKLNAKLGKFVNLFEREVFTLTLDSVYSYPKNVAVLTNKYNGSTAEQFLLAAKQSVKTKLFGTTTMGVLDISNMHFVTSPCGKIQLGYCLSKSLRIPDMAIDDKGIQPDYYLDNSIPDYEWVEFAEKTFSEHKK